MQMTALYGADPRSSAALSPPPYRPTPLPPAQELQLRDLIEAVLSRADAIAADGVGGGTAAETKTEAKTETAVAVAAAVAAVGDGGWGGEEDKALRSDEKDLSEDVCGHQGAAGSKDDKGEGDEEAEVELEDDTEERMKNSDWWGPVCICVRPYFSVNAKSEGMVWCDAVGAGMSWRCPVSWSCTCCDGRPISRGSWEGASSIC